METSASLGAGRKDRRDKDASLFFILTKQVSLTWQAVGKTQSPVKKLVMIFFLRQHLH